ncbi:MULTISPECIES: MerR family transcriptional regulator [Ferrimicrobium]
MRIGQIAKLTHVSVRNLRYYKRNRCTCTASSNSRGLP